jgi:lipoprotein-anchoring transpeptidase ErfK/SrfK
LFEEVAMSALGKRQTFAPQNVMSAFPPKADMCGAKTDVRFGPKADIGPTSDEHSDAWQDNPDLGELARLRIIDVQRTWPTARNHARARPCREWGNCRRTEETVDLIPTVPHHFHLGIELVLIRHVATVAAIAALLGPVSLAQAQSDNELLRGGATKKGIYNIFGFDGTGLGRTTVRYDSKYAPGTIVINTAERRLYLVQGGGSALRYGIGVGRAGFQWKGAHKITAKKEFPNWTAPPEMIARQRDVPRHMKGGDPDNPLGTRAMYLGSTLYRIHGSNDPDSVGEAESSGCFRMRNEDIADLYNRVPVGTTVVVQ